MDVMISDAPSTHAKKHQKHRDDMIFSVRLSGIPSLTFIFALGGVHPRHWRYQVSHLEHSFCSWGISSSFRRSLTIHPRKTWESSLDNFQLLGKTILQFLCPHFRFYNLFVLSHLHLPFFWGGSYTCWGWPGPPPLTPRENPPPENGRVSPKRGPFQKEMCIFQPSIFRGYVSFKGGKTVTIQFSKQHQYSRILPIDNVNKSWNGQIFMSKPTNTHHWPGFWFSHSTKGSVVRHKNPHNAPCVKGKSLKFTIDLLLGWYSKYFPNIAFCPIVSKYSHRNVFKLDAWSPLNTPWQN